MEEFEKKYLNKDLSKIQENEWKVQNVDITNVTKSHIDSSMSKKLKDVIEDNEEDIVATTDASVKANIKRQKQNINEYDFETELDAYKLELEKKKLLIQQKLDIKAMKMESKMKAQTQRIIYRLRKWGLIVDPDIRKLLAGNETL